MIAALFGYFAGRALRQRKYIRDVQQHGSYQRPGAFLELLK